MTLVGIAGLGTVGTATATLLHAQAKDLNLTLKCVSARSKDKQRDCDLSSVIWCDNPLDMVDQCDIIVELIGGADGIAKELVARALCADKSVVTANKALLAANTDWITHPNMYYEAAVGGGVPMIRTVKAYLQNNKITRIRGILNGTCNYILTRMQQDTLDFETVLAHAQSLGYAEADPTADIDAHDTAQKLIILCALAFGQTCTESQLPTQGIRDINDATGIKLIAEATLGDDNVLHAHVAPMDANHSPLQHIHGVDNALLIDCEPLGTLTLTGPGAGGGATATAVVADIIDASKATA